MSRRVILTGDHRILDQGKPLWPAREPPTDHDQAVWAALDQLSDRQREIIEMRHYGDLTFSAIGKRLGISKQAVHATYHKAIEQLREALNEIF